MRCMTRRLEIWGLGCSVLAWLGCGGAGPPRGNDSGTAGSSTGAATDIGSSTSTSSTSTSGAVSADDTRDTASSDGMEVIFLLEPDGWNVHFECDVFEQDCPRGQKCTAWAHDGGDTVNATKCVPVVEDPAGLNEPCHVEGSPLSGIDDCGFGDLCWDVDPETLQGHCVPFCTGDENNPHCDEPGWFCDLSESGDGLCAFRCDPIAQDCPPGQACYPVQDDWDCGPDASGEGGAYGDPCEFINVCDPGLACLDTDVMPPGLPCEGASGCCSEVCDLSDPAGDMQCAGVAEGQICQPWYDGGGAPPGHENVGACVLPA